MEFMNQSTRGSNNTTAKIAPQLAVVAGCLLGAQFALQLVVPVSLLLLHVLLHVLQGLCQLWVFALRIFGI